MNVDFHVPYIIWDTGAVCMFLIQGRLVSKFSQCKALCLLLSSAGLGLA